VVIVELEDAEVQMRRAWRRVARRPDIADDVALRNRLAIVQAVGVPLEVGVVVRELVRRIELIDRVAAGLADEELGDCPIAHGVDGRVARRENVHRFVRPVAATLGESALPRVDIAAVDRHAQILRGPGRGDDAFGADRRGACGLGLGRVHVGSGIGDDRLRPVVAVQLRLGGDCRLRRSVRIQRPHGERARAECDEQRRERNGVARGLLRHRLQVRQRNFTGVPGLTSAATRAASQLVSRTHPCDCVRPTVPGSGVPCNP